VTRDNAYKKLTDDEKKLFRVIYKSPGYPNQTFTVGERVKPDARGKLAALLTAKKPIPAAEGVFSQFSKNAKFFEPTKTSEFTDLESLLEGVVWGW
jgi:ABC-type phosphate/phosphonate transport system substrate-binding protein